MLSTFNIFKTDDGDIHLSRSLTATDGKQAESMNCVLVLTPPMQAKLAEWFRQEERAMLGSIHADGGVSYETWLAERQAAMEDDALPATDKEWAARLAEGCKS